MLDLGEYEYRMFIVRKAYNDPLMRGWGYQVDLRSDVNVDVQTFLEAIRQDKTPPEEFRASLVATERTFREPSYGGGPRGFVGQDGRYWVETSEGWRPDDGW